VITWRNGTVSRVRREWPGAVELDVTISDRPDAAVAPAVPVRALAYPALTGRPEPGDRVLLNTTALDLGLGTGGYALVVAVPDRLPPDRSGPGHLVKARYTPLQAVVLGADEQGSPHHDTLRNADGIATRANWRPTIVQLAFLDLLRRNSRDGLPAPQSTLQLSDARGLTMPSWPALPVGGPARRRERALSGAVHR